MKNYYRSNKSLYEEHTNRLNEFKKNKDQITHLKNNVIELKGELESTSRKHLINKKINQIQKEICTYENFDNELDYYSRVGDILFDYYDETYGGLYNICIEGDTKSISKDRIQISNDLYNLKAGKVRKKPRKRPVFTSNMEGNDGCLAQIEGEYFTVIGEVNKYPENAVICPECNTERIATYNNEQLICTNPKCSIVEELIIEPNAAYGNTTFIGRGKYPYRRVAHFTEKLKQFLCMDGVDIPEHVYDTIKSDMAKHGYTNNDITVRFITRSLKRNKLSKYYDNIMLIYCKLKNVSPPTIKYSEYERMIKMFKQVDAVYEDKFKPKNRINSLRYSLVMFKLFIIIGKLGHARSLKLLKDYKILKEQFNIIDKIFNHLGWKASKVNTKKCNYRFCQEDGCTKQPIFNTPDQIKK